MNSSLSPLEPQLPSKPGEKLRWHRPYGCGLSLALVNAATQHNGPIIVITPSQQKANAVVREVKAFMQHKAFPVHLFPDWETLPYDSFSPHEDITSDRLLALSRLPLMNNGIVALPISTFAHRLPPTDFVNAHTLALKVGDTINVDHFLEQCTNNGYHRTNQVMTHGELTVRGSIIDIFPMGHAQPVRIDFFDNEIDSLRYFDPDNQRSMDKIDSLVCLPAREFPTHDEAITRFRQNWRERFAGDPSHSRIYQSVSEKQFPQGIEYYLPLFFQKTATFADYLPANALIIKSDDCDPALDQFWQEIAHRYDQFRHDIERPILPPDALFLESNTLHSLIKSHAQITLTDVPSGKKNLIYDCHANDDIHLNVKSNAPLGLLQAYCSKYQEYQIVFCAESAGRREALIDLLKKAQITPHVFNDWSECFESSIPVSIIVAPIDVGARLPLQKCIIIAESELHGHHVMQRRRRKSDEVQSSELQFRHINELEVGTAVVHLQHGVGKYQGLKHINVNGIEAEYLVLEYAGNDKLYLPVSSIHLISRYSGAGTEHANLNRLGTEQWEKAKRKAQEKMRDVAAELLNLHAKRAAKSGFAMRIPQQEYFQFASTFGFEETPDQRDAIENVLKDMQSPHPMDRLICGDVGFGKTEVAMRAAFISAMNNKQTAVLVPTTLLAQQHFENFQDRFADLPVRIEMLSRFKSAKEQIAILDSLAEGKIDIIIGTHKILQNSVKFHALGLLIIDEEHRFGVRHKEQLKKFRAEVDILAMTATPIPRTLNMAMASMRDLSIIATPPAKRLSIRTFVREYQQALIIEAIQRELMRGGQVYYLHNEVETIERCAQDLQQLLPHARVQFAHGQMRERQLEKVMTDFYHQRFNVLVCTTIIETGIDIPSANTIIIERADKFGLAQLHQLRGRVGRSHHQAYAYCLIPSQKRITKDAIKRLEALESAESLGAGFMLATHDLEIRGAGELLGQEQSGNMEAIGFNLYMELLERAVKALKSGQNIDWDELNQTGPEIDLHLAALIPESYIHDINTRLTLYKRIANAKSERALQELQVEMIDRFGLLPDAVKNLFQVTLIKLKALPIGIKKIEAHVSQGKIEFEAKPKVDPERIIKMIRDEPKHFKLAGSEKILFYYDMQSIENRISTVENILSKLT